MKCLGLNIGVATLFVVSWAAIADTNQLPSHATPIVVALTYFRPAVLTQCPDETTLRRDVSARLGRDPFVDEAHHTSESAIGMTVTVSAEGPGLRAQVRSFDAAGRQSGERVLTSASSDCRELAAAIGLAIAMAIDPIRATRVEPVAPIQGPTPAATTTSPAVVTATPSTQPVIIIQPTPTIATQMPWQLSLGVGPHIGIGASPGVSFSPAIDLQLRKGWWSAGVYGRFAFPTAETQSNHRVSVYPLVGGSVACVHYRFLSGCGLLSAGALQSRGEALDGSGTKTATTWLVAPGGRAGVEFPIGWRLSVQVMVDLWVPITRTTVTILGTSVWSSSRVMLWIGPTLAVRL